MHNRTLTKLLIGTATVLFFLGLATLIHEAIHCTVWQEVEYKTMDCTYYMKGVCQQYVENRHTKQVCVARDDQ